MADSNAFSLFGKSIKRFFLPWVLPRIAELQPDEWEKALKKAREANFDMIERLGILAAIAFTTYLLRFDSRQTENIALPLQYVIQFLAAVPLLVLFAGPFYLRCLRRGLDHEIEHRYLAGNFDHSRRHHHDQN